jgi:hypothetical protein
LLQSHTIQNDVGIAGIGSVIGRAWRRAYLWEAVRRGLPAAEMSRLLEGVSTPELRELLHSQTGALEGSRIRSILRARGDAL